MSRLKRWLDDYAGEYNGVAPDATHREVLVTYAIFVALVVGAVFFVWKDMQ